VLTWALAGRGLITIGLLIPALKFGLGRPAGPLLRLLLLPFIALLAARGLSYIVLLKYSRLDLVEQLFIGGGIAALGFAGVMLLGAPRRVWAMTSHLHRALLGRIPAEPNFL
jgi:hypothetical protein